MSATNAYIGPKSWGVREEEQSVQEHPANQGGSANLLAVSTPSSAPKEINPQDSGDSESG